MKIIELKNKDLVNIYDMLDKLGIEGHKPKRGKGKLQRNIKAKHEEYAEDLKAIQDDYFEKDEEDNYKQERNAQGVQVFVWKDGVTVDEKKEANEATKELADEVAVIDIVENETKIKSLYDAVVDDDFTTKDGFKDEPFDILMDALEETFEKENE